VASPPTRMKPATSGEATGKHLAGPSGVVGDSARGQIGRGAWEALPGGSESDQRAAGRHNRRAAGQGVGEAHSSEEAG
jgi:hypothetical protein